MKAFKNQDGVEFQLRLNVYTIKKIRDAIGFDILDVADAKSIEALMNDPVLLCNVIYVLCEDQCEKIGMSDVQFGESMAGDAIADATKSLLAELVDFFPKGRRDVLSLLLQKLEGMSEKMVEKAMGAMNDGTLDRAFQEALSGKTSMDSQALPG